MLRVLVNVIHRFMSILYKNLTPALSKLAKSAKLLSPPPNGSEEADGAEQNMIVNRIYL